jgi:hypothetical protein
MVSKSMPCCSTRGRKRQRARRPRSSCSVAAARCFGRPGNSASARRWFSLARRLGRAQRHLGSSIARIGSVSFGSRQNSGRPGRTARAARAGRQAPPTAPVEVVALLEPGHLQRAASLAARCARCRPGTSAARRACRPPSPGRAPSASSAVSARAQSMVSATPGSLNRSICAASARRPRPRATAAAGPAPCARRISSSRAASGIVDPVVEAAALHGVVDLARAVGRDDHDRRRLRLHRAELGDRDLEVGQHLQQEGLEGLVGAVELVDQQHRRRRLALERLQQRALDQEALGEDVVRSSASRSTRPAPRPAGSRSSGAA